jgi:hypothetical protein
MELDFSALTECEHYKLMAWLQNDFPVGRFGESRHARTRDRFAIDDTDHPGHNTVYQI